METGGFYQGFLQSLAVRRPIRRCLCQRLIRTAGDPVVIAGPKGLISEELGISQPSYCKLHCSSSFVGWFQAAWWSDVMLWPLRYLALRVKSQDSRSNFIHLLICVAFFYFFVWPTETHDHNWLLLCVCIHVCNNHMCLCPCHWQLVPSQSALFVYILVIMGLSVYRSATNQSYSSTNHCCISSMHIYRYIHAYI